MILYRCTVNLRGGASASSTDPDPAELGRWLARVCSALGNRVSNVLWEEWSA